MKTTFILLLLAPLLLSGQVKKDSGTPIEGEIYVNGYMCGIYGGLLNNDHNLILLEISCASRLAKRSHYAVIDLKTMTLISQFEMKKWSYLHESYFYEDSVLYLSFGRPLNTKYMVFDITNGQLKTKAKGKNCPYGPGYYSKDLNLSISGGYDDLAVPYKQFKYVFTFRDNHLRWVKKKKK